LSIAVPAAIRSHAKLSKAAVHYGPGMPGSRCDICTHWRPPESCELVAGKIEKTDWCNRFHKDRSKVKRK